MTSLERLETWYASQCNGDWEHEWGVRISTLDNPGWAIKVNLEATNSEGLIIEPIEIERGTDDWIVCRTNDGALEAFCGPRNLEESLKLILDSLGA